MVITLDSPRRRQLYFNRRRVINSTVNTRQAHGFTLIELLVIMAIIGTIIAIVLPALAGARESARRVQCATNASHVVKAGHAYAVERGGKWCIATAAHRESNNTLWTARPPNFIHYGQLYGTYLISGDVFYCPSSPIFKMEDPTYGSHNLGEIDRVAVGSYFQRGVPEGAPLSNYDRVNKTLLTDLVGFKSTPPNHGELINAAYMDGSVTLHRVPEKWSIMTANGHGGDTTSGAEDGAWSQLDERAFE